MYVKKKLPTLNFSLNLFIIQHFKSKYFENYNLVTAKFSDFF